MFCLIASTAGAERKTAQVAEDFDLKSPSGCVNVTSPTHGGQDYSIWLSGGWGTFEMNEFIGVSIELWAQTYSAGGSAPDTLTLSIKGADGQNTITIDINAPSRDETKVKVTDEYDGEEQAEDETISERIYNTWAKVLVTIRATDDETDGTAKTLDIFVNGRTAIDGFRLFSGELSENIEERSFREVEFRVVSEYADVYLSEIAIETTTYSTTGGFNVTFILVAIGSTILVLVLVFKRQTIGAKVDAARDKISQP